MTVPPKDPPNVPQGYAEIPDDDRNKARLFFERGKTVADTGNYEYAIEMYIQGLRLDPDAVEAHQTLREISLRRKMNGGKPMGMGEKWGLKNGAPKDNMLNAEKLLAYDPGNTDAMVQALTNAQKGGFYDTVLWIGPLLYKANSDAKKPEYNKFITLKDAYKAVEAWKPAVEACYAAQRLRPDDMDLSRELKDLAAMDTIKGGGYGSAGSFRDVIKNMDSQRRLLDEDKDVRSEDVMTRQIREAERDYNADPNDPVKLTKLVENLIRTDQPEFENRAIELLDEAFSRTNQFKFRQKIGIIKMKQLNRLDATLRAAVKQDPTDANIKKEYAQFAQDKATEELNEYRLWAENYPTDTSFKFEMAKRLFMLHQFDDAIPVFQVVRNDPKYRVNAAIFLGRAFLESGYIDEAVDTLRTVLDEYPGKGDDRSKEMTYWYGRGLEAQKDFQAALKAYSQVTQMDFNYRDTQARIKALRQSLQNPPPDSDLRRP